MPALIIDGRNLCWRSTAVAQGGLTTPGGRPVSVVYGFVKALHSTVQRHQCDRVIVAWDSGVSGWRRQIFPQYKHKVDPGLLETQRLRAEVGRQEAVLRFGLLPRLPVIQIHRDNTEADDLICAACCVFPGSIIESTDRDFFQLLDIADLARGKDLYTADLFTQDWGFPPSRWVEYRAAVGDPSDGIPGVPGVGEVTARKALQEYSGLERWANATSTARARSVLDSLDVLARNKALIDLLAFPHLLDVANVVRKAVDTPVNFDGRRFRRWLYANGFMSVLRHYQIWSETFDSLVRGDTSGKGDGHGDT